MLSGKVSSSQTFHPTFSLLHFLIGTSDQQIDFRSLFYILPQSRILAIVILNESTSILNPYFPSNISKQNYKYAL